MSSPINTFTVIKTPSGFVMSNTANFEALMKNVEPSCTVLARKLSLEKARSLMCSAEASLPHLPAALTAQPLPPRGMAEPGANRQRTSAPGAGISHSHPTA